MKLNQLFLRTILSKQVVWVLLLPILNTVLISTIQAVKIPEVPPALEFPQIGLDDESTYQGYTTRFYRDSEGNTLQIAINHNTGRTMNIWADAVNESISFTARDATGQPVRLTWDSPVARIYSEGTTRFVEYSLTTNVTALDIGLFILASMRIERDFGYQNQLSSAFDSEPFIVNEFITLIESIEKLPAKIQKRHLALLKAKNVNELYARLVPHIKSLSKSSVLVEQLTLDGNNRLSLELAVDRDIAKIDVFNNKISIASLTAENIQLTVKLGTDSPSLTPLSRDDIFNSDFIKFYESIKNDNRHSQRFQRLERQVKSMELLSSQEKLMAGLPNYGTYFGRDMMMSALMLEPVWKPEMLEHVIASVLRKLTRDGQVSHEEGLGGQAIRENGVEYSKLITKYLKQKKEQVAEAGNTLSKAEYLLGNLQKTTENYRMVDDDFQLPVLAARYLGRSDISADQKRTFLQSAVAEGDDETTRLTMLMRNILYMTKLAQPYVENPVAENLVSFSKADERRWHPGSWRDSGVGYANGRYAMDINAVWVPQALKAVENIFLNLKQVGYSPDDLEASAPEIRNTHLAEYISNPDILQQAIKTWQSADRHFELQLRPDEIQLKLASKLNWFPVDERNYWKNLIIKNNTDKKNIAFLALSLDEQGHPIPVVNTDVATWLFLEYLTDNILINQTSPEAVVDRLRIFIVPFPVGLFLDGVGPAVANDTYASPEVWENFKRDLYHSPQVVWGREVNLLLLGLAKQIQAAYDSDGQIKDPLLIPYVQELRAILNKTVAAVESSGLQHNELWSYRIKDNTLLPARYATTTDIQLWNLTNLAVQFTLDRISN